MLNASARSCMLAVYVLFCAMMTWRALPPLPPLPPLHASVLAAVIAVSAPHSCCCTHPVWRRLSRAHCSPSESICSVPVGSPCARGTRTVMAAVTSPSAANAAVGCAPLLLLLLLCAVRGALDNIGSISRATTTFDLLVSRSKLWMSSEAVAVRPVAPLTPPAAPLSQSAPEQENTCTYLALLFPGPCMKTMSGMPVEFPVWCSRYLRCAPTASIRPVPLSPNRQPVKRFDISETCTATASFCGPDRRALSYAPSAALRRLVSALSPLWHLCICVRCMIRRVWVWVYGASSLEDGNSDDVS